MSENKRRAVGLALATAVAAGGAAVAVGAPASAATARCDMSVVAGPTSSTRYLRIVCTQRDPYDYPQVVDLFGEDGWTGDDHLKTLYPVSYYPMYLLVKSSTLNEDYGAGDEIYVRVLFRTSLGGRYVVQSNTVYGYWS